jgi:uncharacterized membrane protein YdjX (TVP38/TMEM64 family)
MTGSEAGLRRRVLGALLGTGVVGGVLLAASPGIRLEARTAWALLLSADPEALRSWLLGFGLWAPLLSGFLQIVSSVIPFLPGFVLGIANAMLYGAILGGILTFVTALIAAGVCFGLARVLGRPGVERVVSTGALERVDRFVESKGLWTVFLGRLIPFINPDVLSYAAGATRMGWIPFLAAMAAGALPATIFYSIIGAMVVESTLLVVSVVVAATVIPLVLLALFRERIAWWGKRSARAGRGPRA